MKITSRCPRMLIEQSIDAPLARSAWDLDVLTKRTQNLEVEGYMVTWADKGLIEDCFESSFVITLSDGSLQSLPDLLNELKLRSTPPDLSGLAYCPSLQGI